MLVETCERKIWYIQIFNIIFGVNVVVSKVSRGAKPRKKFLGFFFY